MSEFSLDDSTDAGFGSAMTAAGLMDVITIAAASRQGRNRFVLLMGVPPRFVLSQLSLRKLVNRFHTITVSYVLLILNLTEVSPSSKVLIFVS